MKLDDAPWKYNEPDRPKAAKASSATQPASQPVTFRLHIHSLDSAAATFKWASGLEVITVSMDTDRFKTLGRPGSIEVAISPIGGVA